MRRSYTKEDWVTVGMGVIGICFLVVFLNLKLMGKNEQNQLKDDVEQAPSVASSMKVVDEKDESNQDKKEVYEDEVKEQRRNSSQPEEFEQDDHVGFTDEREEEKRNVDAELIDKIMSNQNNVSGFVNENAEPKVAKEPEVDKIVSKARPSTKVKVSPIVEIEDPAEEPARVRKTGFNTLRRRDQNLATTMTMEVKGVIHGDQVVSDGASIKLRLKEALEINGIKIRKNTIIYGVLNFSRDRALIDISSMRIGDEIVGTDLKVYGLDGMEGIMINDFAGSSEAKEGVLDEAIGDLGRQIGNKTGVRSVFRGARNENRIEKVTVVGNTKLILK